MLALEQILQYENQHICSRYEKDFPHNRLSAKEALHELIKFFWLCHRHSEDKVKSDDDSLHFTCMIHEEMHELDAMWHTLLLFTKDYHDFCMKYFGYFIHHQPLTEDAKSEINSRYSVELERFLSYTYDRLGEETLTKWFGDCL